MKTIESIQKEKEEERIFSASLQGVDLKGDREKEGPTFEEVRMKALGVNASKDDVISLQGVFAAEAGFGVGAGLGYTKE